ncbi:MAG: hypothetical protein AAFQ63_08315 [Cyanobacteria bacterium J06621_11]
MEISFKPALIRSVQTWKIAEGVLITPKQKRLKLSEVTAAYFVDMPYKGRWNTEFKLSTPNESVGIACNDTQKGEQRLRCFSLIMSVIDELIVHNPALRIRRGFGRIANYAFASIGLIPLGFGLSFIIDAIKHDFDSFGLGFGAFFILMAIFAVWCASPWKSPPMNTPTELKAALFPNAIAAQNKTTKSAPIQQNR